MTSCPVIMVDLAPNRPVFATETKDTAAVCAVIGRNSTPVVGADMPRKLWKYSAEPSTNRAPGDRSTTPGTRG